MPGPGNWASERRCRCSGPGLQSVVRKGAIGPAGKLDSGQGCVSGQPGQGKTRPEPQGSRRRTLWLFRSYPSSGRPGGPVHPLPGCRCTTHAPEAQYWTSKLAMPIAEVGAVRASSTLVWELISGSARWLAVLNMSGRGPAPPDIGKVGDDHGHDRPGPRSICHPRTPAADSNSAFAPKRALETAVWCMPLTICQFDIKCNCSHPKKLPHIRLVRGPISRHVNFSLAPSNHS